MTQKRIIAILLLCALTAACSKDESNGSSNRTPVATAHKYTYGYFHPEKKVKRIVTSYNSEWSSGDSTVYEFTWLGDNLQSIKETIHYEYSNPRIFTYTYHYGGDGYIDQIIEKEQDRIHGDTMFFIYRNNEIAYYTTELRQYLGNDFCETMKPTFDANGNLTAYDDYPVTYGQNNDGVPTVTFREGGDFVEWMYWEGSEIKFPLHNLIHQGINFEGYIDVGELFALKYSATPTTYDSEFWQNFRYDTDGYITEAVYDRYTNRFYY